MAVAGCGAVGGFYGACLCRAGQDVHALLRSDFDAVRRHGLRIRGVRGDWTVPLKAARRSEDIGTVDLVVVALKTTANGAFGALITPLLGPETAILTLQNGLGNEEQLAALFGPGRVLGGLCFVCLNRVEPGVIEHIDHGDIVLGEFRRPAGERARTIAEAFRAGGVACQVTDGLERAHWGKLVWNIPFNGLGVASAAGIEAVLAGDWEGDRPGLVPCLTTDRLLADQGWARLVRELMAEVMAAAHALGLSLPPETPEALIQRTLTMGAYRASTVLDFEHGRPIELDSLFRVPLAKAQAAGVSTPRLAALCRVLGRVQAARLV